MTASAESKVPDDAGVRTNGEIGQALSSQNVSNRTTS